MRSLLIVEILGLITMWFLVDMDKIIVGLFYLSFLGIIISPIALKIYLSKSINSEQISKKVRKAITFVLIVMSIFVVIALISLFFMIQ